MFSITKWTFLTNHGQVLLRIARRPASSAREIAAAVGITERAAQRIVDDLEEAGYITRHRDGRRNFYDVHRDVPMRHPAQQGHTVGDLLAVLGRAD